MGAELLEERPELFDRYMGLADEASGLPVRALALEGPPEELTRTDVAQPALFALSMALVELARELELAHAFVAGHSLGEYTAAAAAGSLQLEEGMGLVSQRGRLMADIQSRRPGSMAAIIGLDSFAVERLCQQASDAGVVGPANINSPTQVVVSGEDAAVARVLELAPDAGAKRAVRLRVGAAFHSQLMEPVQRELAGTMERLKWQDPQKPLVSNATGNVATTADEVRQALIAQIASPVLWVDCVRTLLDRGCRTFLELGPGRVLGGLVRQIDPTAEVFAADSSRKLAEFSAA